MYVLTPSQSLPYDFDFDTVYRLLLPNDTRTHGYLTPSTVAKLPWTNNFSTNHTDRTVRIEGDATSQSVNAALQSVIDRAIQSSKDFPSLNCHSEMFQIIGATYPVQLERFAAPLFGIACRGAHMTAFVNGADGKMRIWVARRAKNLFTYPGMLDTTVAGGVKASDTPLECIVAEADEEASLPAVSVRDHVVATGVVTYVSQSRKTGNICPQALWVYDLELPETVTPVPKDEEVEAFYLWDVEQVTEAMMKGEFKPNCNLVMIDFFMRHGIVSQENEKDYLEIASRLRRRLPVPTTPNQGW